MSTHISTEQDFKRHAKVVAAEDLPFVPAGTKGKVMYAAGLTWIRYHVDFENGQVRSSVDGSQLVTPAEWADRQKQQAETHQQDITGGVS